MFDVLIAGGDVYDGSGEGPVPADVGVRGDRVAAVGRGLPREAGAVVGYSDRPATPAELDRMRQIAAEEMADGALGIASALVYPPGSYAGIGELASLCEVAADYDG